MAVEAAEERKKQDSDRERLMVRLMFFIYLSFTYFPTYRKQTRFLPVGRSGSGDGRGKTPETGPDIVHI